MKKYLLKSSLFKVEVFYLFRHFHRVSCAQIVKPGAAFFFYGDGEKRGNCMIVTGHLRGMFTWRFLTVGFKIHNMNRICIFKKKVDGSVNENFFSGFIFDKTPERKLAFPQGGASGDFSQGRQNKTAGQLFSGSEESIRFRRT